jgi:hypothetical protein
MEMKAVKKWMWRHQRSRSWDGQESELRKADTESPTALGMTKSNERHGQRREGHENKEDQGAGGHLKDHPGAPRMLVWRR